MRGGITDAGRRTTISEDRATQPMEAILKAFLLNVNCSYQYTNKVLVSKKVVFVMHPRQRNNQACEYVKTNPNP